MADDGLLLNFTVPSGPVISQTVLRGGPWRERRRIEQKQKNRVRNDSATSSKEPARAESNSHEVSREAPKPIKRRRIESSRPPAIQNAVDNLRGSRNFAPKRQVISSLFTSNPSTKTLFDEEPETISDRVIEPSNAPLTEEQNNFTNLGLSSKIALHLTSKLSITAPTAIQKATIPILLQDDSDAFIQAQTGSGKTLAYVLPIVDRILKISANETSSLNRNSGLFAIILAPTRELCKQISLVLESTLRFVPGIVAGMVMGGEKKKSEKARLRKGLNILVATPGRLADHFDHTEVLDVSSVRWLVLDEGDRLMDLGFEEDIKRILSRLDFRLKNPKVPVMDSLPKKRISILCSATMRSDVQKLGDISLMDAHHITTDTSEENDDLPQTSELAKKFTVPAQLKQTYIIVPAKLRLVTLHAILKKSFNRCLITAKVIVFLSCADSVDFHFQVFARPGHDTTEEPRGQDITNSGLAKQHFQSSSNGDMLTSSASPSISTTLPVTVFRLHGSLVQSVRTSTLSAFSKSQSPALLLCTDIASRGLDLPHVDRIIEYDAAFSREEHLHRVGRTARAGKEGQATVFLMPGCEEGYVNVLREERGGGEGALNVRGQSSERILQAAFGDKKEPGGTTTSFIKRKGFTGDDLRPWEEHATDFQLDVERWALENPTILEGARRAFQSYIRAYATHVKEERNWFDIKQLHLGHLAKAFALRDRPGNVNVPGMRATAGQVKADRKKAGTRGRSVKEVGSELLESAPQADQTASKARMRKMGMMTGGVDEFNLA
jgi:ATP-dependent RNA helicase DDX31/DBP7